MAEHVTVSVEDDGTTLLDDARNLVKNHKTAFVVIGIIGVGLLLNRAMIRRELKHINFSFERAPDFDSDYQLVIDDEITRRGMSWAS